jgi:flagellar biogenesis protein FliO
MTAFILGASTAELTIRMVVALAVVALLLMILSRMMRRVLGGRNGRRPAIAIRHQQRLDKHASVTLLTAGDRNLLVGTAGQSIVLLAEGDDLAAPAPGPDPGGVADDDRSTIDVRNRGLTNPIKSLQNKTVRRG